MIAAHGNRDALFDLQHEFFTKPSSGVDIRNLMLLAMHMIGSSSKFIDLLLAHRLEVYENSSDFVIDSVTYYSGKSYVIPAGQPTARLWV